MLARALSYNGPALIEISGRTPGTFHATNHHV